jgi:hypothetical protein
MSGVIQGVASSLIVVGLLFAVAPLPWENKIKDRVSVVTAIVGVALVPVGVVSLSPAKAPAAVATCHGHPTGSPQSLQLQPYANQAGVSFSPSTPGATTDEVSSPYYEWAGYHAAIPNYCSYSVKFEAREIGIDTSQGATGYGYGVGVCSRLGAETPAGLSVQDNYAVSYLNYSVFNQVLLPSPDAEYGKPINASQKTDKAWHRWVIRVDGGYWSVIYDGYTLIRHELLSGAAPLAKTCVNSDLVFRVWGGQAEFRNVQLAPAGAAA